MGVERGQGHYRGRGSVEPRPNYILFYFRRSLRAFSALPTPPFEPLVPLPFLSPETLSLAAFVAAPLIFLPMSAMLITLLCGVCIYSRLIHRGMHPTIDAVAGR